MKQPVPILRNVNNQWIMDAIPPIESESFFDIKFTTTPNGTEGGQKTTISGELGKRKYVLNIDGPGESGLAYSASLKSTCIVHKSSIFRTWSDEFLWPWVQYTSWIRWWGLV
jgi:hypothetical protein